MTFADEADLATFTGDDSLDSVRGLMLVEQASAVIRSHCRQTFDLVEDDEVDLRGTWNPSLQLPERPVVSVASVAIDDVAVAEWTLVRDRLFRGNTDHTLVTSSRGHWGGPRSTVTVTYTHGFAVGTQPMETLKAVCLQVASRAATNPTAKTRESIGDWSASWDNGGGGFALTAAEQAILDRFRHEYAA